MLAPYGHRPLEIRVAIDIAKRLAVLIPRGLDFAAPDDPVFLDLEHVGKITSDGDFQAEACSGRSVIADVEIFVQSPRRFRG